jgi:hypothetical protein
MRFELFVATRYLRAKRRQVEALCKREPAAEIPSNARNL